MFRSIVSFRVYCSKCGLAFGLLELKCEHVKLRDKIVVKYFCPKCGSIVAEETIETIRQ